MALFLFTKAILNEENNTFFNEYIKKKFGKGINLIKLGILEENVIQIIKEDLTRNKIKIDIFDSILLLKKSENNTQIINHEDLAKHNNRGIYMRDDHCDWGSSGMQDLVEKTNDSN